LEFPQGTYPDLRDGDPVELARQELKEETGLTAHNIEHLGFLYGANGTSSQGFHVFLATDLEHGEHEREAEEADMTQTWTTRNDFDELITSGRIVDGNSIAAYALFQLCNDRQQH
jgi:8-oxo-dGTP pyrophosphatase MutT (NUDIX family)